jgi:hypothetical protein
MNLLGMSGFRSNDTLNLAAPSQNLALSLSPLDHSPPPRQLSQIRMAIRHVTCCAPDQMKRREEQQN